ncbi:MAG: hypothetical protein ACYC5G_02445 [Candidatus Doudnabacteria bacterium]
MSRKKAEEAARISVIMESIARLCKKYNIEQKDHLAVMYGGPGWAHYHEGGCFERFTNLRDVITAARKAARAVARFRETREILRCEIRIGLISAARPWKTVRLYKIP